MAVRQASVIRSTPPKPLFQEIVPVRIRLFDQREFPYALPALDVRFAPDGVCVQRVLFEPDELGDIVFVDEFRSVSFTMRPHPPGNVARHACVKRTVALARQDVDEAARHCSSPPVHVSDAHWMAGSWPAMVRKSGTRVRPDVIPFRWRSTTA